MKNRYLLKYALGALVLLFMMNISLNAQSPDTQKTYDILGHTEKNFTLTRNSNGEFVIASSNDVIVPVGTNTTGLTFIKLDSCLDTILVKSVFPTHHTDPLDFIEAYDIETHGDNYVLCGSMSHSSSIGPVGWSMIVDANFDMVEFSYYNSQIYALHAVLPTSDGNGYLLAGATDFGAVAFRVNLLLQNLFPIASTWNLQQRAAGCFYDMVRTDSNEVALTGRVTGTNDVDLVVVGCDDNAASLWSICYDAPELNSNEVGKGLYFDNVTQNLYVTGEVSEPDGNDVLGLELPIGGPFNWIQRYDLNGVGTEIGEKLLKASDGNLRITGTVLHPFPSTASLNGFMINANGSTGEPIYVEMYGTAGSEELVRIEENSPGNFVMVGTNADRIYGVQSHKGNAVTCDQKVYTIDTIPSISYISTATEDTVDNTTFNVFVDPYTTQLDVSTLCDGCVCSFVAPEDNYYHVIDTTINGVLQRMMNEGDQYTGLYGDGMIYTHTSTANSGNVLVVNTLEDGTIQWSNVYGTNKTDQAYCVRTVNNGFIVGGITDYLGARHPFLMKIDRNGNKQWTKVYKSGSGMSSMKMIVLSDGNIVIASSFDAWITPSPIDEVVLIKTDANGNLLEHKVLTQNPVREWDHLTDLVEAGDYIVAIGRGGQNENNDYNPGMMIKLDKSLNVIWARHYRYRTTSNIYKLDTNNSTNSHVKLYAVEHVNGHYYAAGVVSDDNQDNNTPTFRHLIWMKINPTNGALLSYKTYENPDNVKTLIACDMRYDSSSQQFILVGNTKDGSEQRSILVKLNFDGSLDMAKMYGDGKKNMATYIQVATDGDYIFSGMHGTDGSNTIRPYYAKVASDGTGSNVCYAPLSLTAQSDSVEVFQVNFTPFDRDNEVSITFIKKEVYCLTIRPCDNSLYKWLNIDGTWNEANSVAEGPTIYPNPMTGNGTIRIDLEENAQVSISLFDMVSGQLVKQVSSEQFYQRGIQEINIETTGIATGTYVCNISINGKSYPVKVVIMK